MMTMKTGRGRTRVARGDYVWELVHRGWGNSHKLWRDAGTGRLAIADQSGETPSDVDDAIGHGGVLWLVCDEPLLACGHYDGHNGQRGPTFRARVEPEHGLDNKGLTVVLASDTAAAVSRLTGAPLVAEIDGHVFEIAPMRERVPRGLQSLASEAVEIQDASNLAAVAGAMQRAHSALSARLSSSGAAARHVIMAAYIDKLMDMTGVDGRLGHRAWSEVHDIAEGDMSGLELLGDTLCP